MKQVYVGNISYSKSEDDIQTLFEQYGEVLSVKFIKDRESGRFRGFGFVEMATPECAAEAISELEGNEYDGRTLRVNPARERPPRPPHDSW